MHTRLHHELTDRGGEGAALVELQPRRPDRAEHVKGGYDDRSSIVGRAALPPSRRSQFYDWW